MNTAVITSPAPPLLVYLFHTSSEPNNPFTLIHASSEPKPNNPFTLKTLITFPYQVCERGQFDGKLVGDRQVEVLHKKPVERASQTTGTGEA